MELVHVVSSNIDQIGHDEDSGLLHVVFKDGSTYAYSDVPRGVYEELMVADSVGSYFNREIRNVYSNYRV